VFSQLSKEGKEYIEIDNSSQKRERCHFYHPSHSSCIKHPHKSVSWILMQTCKGHTIQSIL